MYERGYTKVDTYVEGEKKPRPLLARVVLGFLVVVFVAGAIIAFRHPSLQIVHTEVQGVEVLDPEQVRATISSYLSEKVLWIFPRSSIFLFSSKKAEHRLREFSTRIKFVDVEKKYFQGLKVSIEEHMPSYVWCRHDESSDCYFMTADGIVYTKAPQFSGSVYTKIIAGDEQELPFIPLSPQDIRFIELYKNELPKKEIYPEMFYYRDGRMLTIITSTKTNPKTEFLVRADTDPEIVLNALAATLRTPEFTSDYSAGRKILYIDFRVPNRVAYRFE